MDFNIVGRHLFLKVITITSKETHYTIKKKNYSMTSEETHYTIKKKNYSMTSEETHYSMKRHIILLRDKL